MSQFPQAAKEKLIGKRLRGYHEDNTSSNKTGVAITVIYNDEEVIEIVNC